MNIEPEEKKLKDGLGRIKNEMFEQELKRRSEAFKSGRSKRYSWEEAKAMAARKLKARNLDSYPKL